MSWRVVKLGELIESFSVKAKDFNVDVSELDFLGVSNTEGITKSKYAAEEKADDYKIMEKGCFAYNPYRINVGSIAMLEDDIVGLISPAYVVFKVKEKSIIPELLLKFLKSSEGLRQIKLHARGTVRQALRFSDLCKIEISLPKYYEQQEFYKTISNTEIESSIISSELTHQLDLVKQLRQAFLQEAMQGELTKEWRANHPELIEGDSSATALLKKIKAEKEKLIKEKEIKKQKPLPPITEDEIPFEIPEGWVWCRLGEVSNNRLGKMLDGIKNKGEMQPYLRNLNVQWYHFELNDIKKMRFELSEFEEYSIKKGDLLICEGGEPGRCAIWNSDDESFKFQKALHRVRFLGNIESWVYQYYFDFICRSKLIIEYYTGAGIKHLTGKSLNKMLLPLPPPFEQQLIVTKLDKLMAYCDSLEESIKNSQVQNEMLLGQVLREALEVK